MRNISLIILIGPVIACSAGDRANAPNLGATDQASVSKVIDVIDNTSTTEKATTTTEEVPEIIPTRSELAIGVQNGSVALDWQATANIASTIYKQCSDLACVQDCSPEVKVEGSSARFQASGSVTGRQGFYVCALGTNKAGKSSAWIASQAISLGVDSSSSSTSVQRSLTALAVTSPNSTRPLGFAEQFTATATFSDGTTADVSSDATWVSSKLTVASISNTAGNKGRLSPLAVGTSEISANLNGVTSPAKSFSYTPATLTAIAVTSAHASAGPSSSEPFTATGTYSDATTANITAAVTWTSSHPSVATISNSAGTKGQLTTIAAGATTIAASLDGISSGASSQSKAFTVTTATLTSIAVSSSNASRALGYTEQFTATGTYSDATTADITTTVNWTSSDTSVATISNTAGTNGLLTSVAAGGTTIAASLGGISSSASSQSKAFAVSTAALTSIAVTSSHANRALGYTEQFTATGTYSNATTADITSTVTWVSLDTSVATISNAPGMEGRLTPLAAGTTTVSAHLNGISSNASSQSKIFTVNAAALTSIAVTSANASRALGSTEQFTATGTYSDATTADITSAVTWASSDTTVATISNTTGSKGRLTTVAAGASTISASLSGIDSSASSQSKAFTVSVAVLTAIAVTSVNASRALGYSEQFTATGTYSDTTTADITADVTWASSDTSVATISNTGGTKGQLTSVAAGSTSISASLNGISSAASGQSKAFTVSSAVLTAIAVTSANSSRALGYSEQFTATGTYSNSTTADITGDVTWASADTSIATISNTSGTRGLLSSLATGTTTISASLGGIASTASGQSKAFAISAAVLTAIAVTSANASRALGYTEQYTATGTYSDETTADISTTVTWASSDTTVATISNAGGSKGLATSVATGSTTISASLNGITSGASGQSKALTVSAAVLTAIAVTSSNASRALGYTEQFTATGTYSNATTADITGDVTWASSDTAVGTVSNAGGSKGLLTTAATGTTTVSASLSGITSGASAQSKTLTVTSAVLTAIAVSSANASRALGYTEQFTATGTYSNGTTADITSTVTWASSQTSVATISNAGGSKGLLTSVATGTTSISASLSGVSSGASSQSKAFTVADAALVSLAVTSTNASRALGYTEQFTATGTFSDGSTSNLTNSVTWTSSDTGVATISNAGGSKGLASTVSVGSTSIAASLSGISSDSSSGSKSFSVSSAVLTSISVTSSQASISVGATEQFTATGTYSNTSTQNITTSVTWASSSTSVATISNVNGSRGLLTGVAAGSTTVSATLSGVSSSASGGSKVLSVTSGFNVSADIFNGAQSSTGPVFSDITITNSGGNLTNCTVTTSLPTLTNSSISSWSAETCNGSGKSFAANATCVSSYFLNLGPLVTPETRNGSVTFTCTEGTYVVQTRVVRY